MCKAVVKLKDRERCGSKSIFEICRDKKDIEWLLKLDKHVEEDGLEKWTAWDDVNQVYLDPDKVRAARAEELGYILDMNVFKLIDRQDAINRGIKVVDAKWIDTNKGDIENPNMRSRYVGREFNDSKMLSLIHI